MTTIADNTDSRMNQNTQCSVLCCILFIFHHRPFPYLGSAHRVFNIHGIRYCAYSMLTMFSFVRFLVTSLHISFGLLICRCPPTYVFYVLITTSSPVFLSRWPDHISIGSPIFSLSLVTTCLCSYFFITYLLDHILFHHPLQHSQLCYFKHVLLSLSRYPRITSIYLNRPRDGRCLIEHGDNTV